MLNRVRSLVAVLVLGLPTLAIAQPKQAKPPVSDTAAGDSAAPTTPLVKVKVEDPTTTFLKNEKYTYCDVKILADYWKMPAKQAKANAGSKLQSSAEAGLDAILTDARSKTKLKCTYVDGGFTMKDVKKLAELWHLSIAESKSTIELKLSHGTSIYLKQEIRGSSGDSVDDAYTAFHNQTKYTYCDAHMIGTLWGKSAAEGKKAIGTKLVAKNTKGLVKLVADARKNAKAHEEARCSYDNAGLQYGDLEVLAKLWKKPPEQMKALVAEKIALGQEAIILAQLKKEKAKQPKPAPTPTPTGTSTYNGPTPPDHATPVKPVGTKQEVPPGADSVTSPGKPATPKQAPAPAPTTKQAVPPASAPTPTKQAPAPTPPTKAG